MKGLILKLNSCVKLDEIEHTHEAIKSHIEKDGFAIIDNRFEVFEIDTDDEKGR